MTPKEKAKELVSKFNFEHTGETYIIHQTVDESKRCALIAIDECIEFEKRIISQLDKITKDARGSFICESEYYLEVKNEINKL
jgi:hypothetical protein